MLVGVSCCHIAARQLPLLLCARAFSPPLVSLLPLADHPVTSHHIVPQHITTGDNAEIGKINKLVSQVEQVKTNLIIQMEILGRWLAIIVVLIAVGAFLLALLHAHEPFAEAFKSAVAIAGWLVGWGSCGCLFWRDHATLTSNRELASCRFARLRMFMLKKHTSSLQAVDYTTRACIHSCSCCTPCKHSRGIMPRCFTNAAPPPPAHLSSSPRFSSFPRSSPPTQSTSLVPPCPAHPQSPTSLQPVCWVSS